MELELQILDPESGDLVPGASRILDACADEGIEGVDGEFLLSMIEIKTGVCRNVGEVRDDLFPLLRRVRNIAASLGHDLAVGATHPFSQACTCAVAPGDRYQRIRRKQGWLAYHEAVFGMHVHVGVPDGERAIGLINLLTPYLPHLLALSANSAFWQGVDTSFASARTAVFRPAAHAGVPQHCGSWQDFCRYFQVLEVGGALEVVKDLYWDVRPRPDLGTIEFRVFDAPPSPGCLLGLVALTRCLVLDGLRLLAERPDLGAGDEPCHWLAAENKARAARYGLRAECLRQPWGEQLSLAEDTAALLDRLEPLAQEAGEAPYLRVFQPLESYETGADRQRHLFRQAGNWRAVLDEMVGRWARDLEGETPPAAGTAETVNRQAPVGAPSPNGHGG